MSQCYTIIVSVVIAKGGQHFAGAKSGAGACGTRGAANANRLVLRESSGGPRDIVPFVLGRARMEVEDGSAEKRADDGLLQRRDDVRVDHGVHESILDGVEAFGEDVVVLREAHVACNGGRRLVCLSGR